MGIIHKDLKIYMQIKIRKFQLLKEELGLLVIDGILNKIAGSFIAGGNS